MAFTIASNGLILKEGFESSSPLWVLTPNVNGACSYNESGVTLHQVADRVSLSIALPSEDVYMAEIILKHTPKVPFDFAGVVLLSEEYDSVECQSYYDDKEDNLNTFNIIRMIYENDHYTFYASSEGLVWEELGNASIIANRIGLFLESAASDKMSSLEVESFKFYKNPKIAFNGVSKDIYNLSFYRNSDKEFIEGVSYSCDNGKLVVDTRNLVSEDILIVGRTFENKVVFEEVLTLVPGSVYEQNIILELYVNSQLIEVGKFFDIGHLDKENFIPVVIRNKSSDVSSTKIDISAQRYSMFSLGYQNVELAIKDSDNLVDLNYGKSVFIEELLPNESKELIMKIERPDSSSSSNFEEESKFKLVINEG